MSIRYSVVICSIVVLCAGCAAKPRVRTTFYAGETAPVGLTDSYAFPRTFIEVKPVKTDALVEVSARNQTFEEFRVGLSRDDNWGVRTSVSLTKIANSDMVEEIGVETKDQRIAVIEGIGKVITTVPPFAFSGAPCGERSAEPGLIDAILSLDSLSAMRLCGVANASGSTDSDTGWRSYKGLNIWFGPLPPGSRPVGPINAFTQLSGKGLEGSVVYAACREIRLEFKANRYQSVTDPKTGKPVERVTPIAVTR